MSLVAIVGRPNVGKSTLFNRLVGMRQAIVDETAGVTRDRHYGKCEWCGREFSVVDTGGYTSNSDDIFEEEIRKQVVLAIEESDLVLFMVEGQTGITDYDEEVADLLRRSGKPVVLCVNKVDSGEKIYDSFQFYSLGLGEVFSISAANGGGTGELLDEICRVLPQEDNQADDEHPELPHIAIVGKPNVGKSSMTNALLGRERNIVTPLAGTTRDSIATLYNKFGYEFMLVDTAGMRKRAKVHEDLEFYSVMRAIRAIEHSDVCILMIDAQTGMEAQDMAIFNLIQKNRKACVIVVNKWDAIEKDTGTLEAFRKKVLDDLKFMDYAPVLFLSALTGQRVHTVLDMVNQVWAMATKRTPTGVLNDVLADATADLQPPATNGRRLKIYYLTQQGVCPPTFILFVNDETLMHFAYERYLENYFRKTFDFTGTPIRFILREKQKEK